MNDSATTETNSVASTSNDKKQKAPSLPVTNYTNDTYLSSPIGNTENTSYLVAGQPSSEAFAKNEQGKKRDRKVWSILSFVATMIPIILWVFCFISSGGSLNEGGPGAIWWLMIFYYWTLGIPLAAISIAFGIAGLKTSLRRLAIISLSIKAVIIIAIVLILFIALFSSFFVRN